MKNLVNKLVNGLFPLKTRGSTIYWEHLLINFTDIFECSLGAVPGFVGPKPYIIWRGGEDSSLR